jgi:hypothetical protein
MSRLAEFRVRGGQGGCNQILRLTEPSLATGAAAPGFLCAFTSLLNHVSTTFEGVCVCFYITFEPCFNHF